MNQILYNAYTTPEIMNHFLYFYPMLKLTDLLLRLIKAVALEIALIILLLFVFNNYLKYSPVTLSADGIGYYDYLPSCFLRGDFVRKDIPLSTHPEAYAGLPPNAGYVELEDRMVNKYPAGTAILELPFFCWAKCQSPPDASGYEPLFQFAVFCAAIAYLFFGLLFTKLFLRSFGVGTVAVFASQFALIFCTPVPNYVNQDAGFSHVYSFFAIAAFLYFARTYFLKRTLQAFLGACLFLALIFLLRQINIVIVLALPLVAGSWNNFKSGIFIVFTRYNMLIGGMLIIGCMISIQMIAWHLQTGKWIVYSYQGETFDFTESHLFEILFSYRKGLFVYTPFLFVSLICSVYWAVQRNWQLFFQFHVFFFIVTYMLSSWWSWFYGASYGQRVYIDFLPLLALPFAMSFQAAGAWMRILLQALIIVLAYINCVQVYQYSRYILDWTEMDREKYWRIFLKTDDKYRGWVWKRPADLNGFTKMASYRLGNFSAQKGQQRLWSVDFDSITRPDCQTVLRFSFRHNFPDSSDMALLFIVDDTVEGKNCYWYSLPLIHFVSATDKENQRGTTDVILPLITVPEHKKFYIDGISEQYDVLKDCQLDAYVAPAKKV